MTAFDKFDKPAKGTFVRYLGTGGYNSLTKDLLYQIVQLTNNSWKIKENGVGGYTTNIKVNNNSGYVREFDIIHFEPVKDDTMLKLTVNRPAIAWETSITGERIGEPHHFTSENDAQAYAKEQIIESIRKENKYRTFSIFVEKSVARATEPPVTFE